MDRNWLTKLAVVVALALFALWFLAPTVIYFRLPADQRTDDEVFAAAVPDWLPEKHLALGLDLQGGIHLVMGVEVEKAVYDKAVRRAEEIRRFAEEKEVAVTSAKVLPTEPRVAVEIGEGGFDKFEEVVLDWFEDMLVVSREGNRVVLGFREDAMQYTRENAVDQAVKTIRNRVDQWGVTEPQIAKRGDNQVLIQLPGVKDPDRAKDLLGKTAQLEFRIVEDHLTGFIAERQADLPEGVTLQVEQGAGEQGRQVEAYYLQAEDRRPLERARDALEPYLPEGTVLAFERIEVPGQPVRYRTYLLTATAPLTGDRLTDARVALDQQKGGRPYVSIEFDRQGAQSFENLTGENTGRRMAIVLDDTVSSAPVIQERIGGGRASITMGSLQAYDQVLREANDLALVLKAGALPAPVRILEERSVGASLGPDLIRRGMIALLVGGALVLLFMLVYYKASGVVADLALLLNMVFLFAILAAFGATLTLPGLAGIVLTIGMAVDANVIIFERIREELALGKTARAAIDAGYDKAFSAIIDGNLTTGIAAFVLLQYGTGPIRGFAVTLLSGIVSTLFTAVFASRVIMEGINRGKRDRVSV